MHYPLQANPYILFLILILLLLGTSSPTGVKLISRGLTNLRLGANA